MDAPNASYTDKHSNLKIITMFHPKNSSDLYVDNTQLKISQNMLPCTMATFFSIDSTYESAATFIQPKLTNAN